MTKRSLGPRGFTLTETVVAIGLICVLCTIVMGVASVIFEEIKKARMASQEARVISSLLEEIRASPDRYQKDFTGVDITTGGPDPSSLNLPIAWSEDYRGPAAGCTTCPGRLGFSIQTVDREPGLFMVTVYIRNQEVFGHNDTKVYPFLITSK